MAGLVGLATGRHGSARADAPPAAAPAETGLLRLHGRGSLAAVAAKTPGAARVVRRLELLDSGEGRVVGEFVATALGAEASFGTIGPGAAGLEMLSFRIDGDTLFGISAGGARGSERAHAVLGGTGRFAGARGACVERELSGNGTGRGQVEFLVTLVG